MRVAGGGGEAVGGALDGDGVQAEALGGGVPGLAALEELEGLGVGGEPLDGLGREHLDGGDDGLDLAAARGVEAVGEAHDRDHQRDVGLDRADHVAGRGALLGDQREQAVTRLGQRREDLKRLEGSRESLAVALVAGAADDGVRRVDPRGRRPDRRPRAAAVLMRAVMRSREAFWSHGLCHRSISTDLEGSGQHVDGLQPLSASVDGRLTPRASRRPPARASPRARAARRSRRYLVRRSYRPERRAAAGRACLGLTLRPLDDSAQRRLDARRVHGSATPPAPPAPAPARLASPRAPRNFSRASGRRPARRRGSRASGQNSASVEIFSCEIATASPRPARPGERLQARA